MNIYLYFVQPSVSIGNVGQLACDALVSTFGFKKAGYFSPEYFLPLVGYNAFATSLNNKFELTMNSEGIYLFFYLSLMNNNYYLF